MFSVVFVLFIKVLKVYIYSPLKGAKIDGDDRTLLQIHHV